MLAYAHALEHGDVGPVTAALWVTEIVVPAIAGVALLADRARPGWGPVVLIASTVAVTATTVLATSPAQTDSLSGTGHPAPEPQTRQEARDDTKP
jgi:hypothetical protein